jgi:hypothetical protein
MIIRNIQFMTFLRNALNIHFFDFFHNGITPITIINDIWMIIISLIKALGSSGQSTILKAMPACTFNHQVAS